MKTVNIYKYYGFGFNYKILVDHSEKRTNLEYYNSLREYIDLINELDLRVTKECLNLKGLASHYSKIEKLSKNKKTKDLIIDSILHSALRTIIKDTDATLDAELNITIAFLIDEKRMPTETLISNVDKLFSEYTFQALPDIAKYDFEESCKCLVFDRYTACAFHSLRGTEAVIKYLYEKLIGKLATESQTWHDFVSEIQKETKSGNINPAPSEELIINLDSLRKYYRNKTQHPLLIYTSDDSQDTLTHCIRSVNQIIKDLRDRKLI